MIFSTIQDGFASVMASLGMVESDISEINSHLQHIDSDLEAIHGDLTSLAAIDEDLHMIHDDLAAIDTDLHMIHEDLTTLHNDLDAIGASVAQSTTGIAPLSEAIQANSAAINTLSDKLDMISEAVGAVQTSVETEATAAAATPTTLHSGETKQAVAVADFAGDVTKHPTDGVYTASNTFSCDGDVFLDTMTVSDLSTILQSTSDTAATAQSTITVEGFFLYETTDTNPAADTQTNVVLEKTRDFDNRFLSAGAGLVVKGSTDQSTSTNALGSGRVDTADGQRTDNLLVYTNGTTGQSGLQSAYFNIQEYVALQSNKATIGYGITQNIANDAQNATKTNLGTVKLYTITVNWFAASSDTTCSISSAVETVSGLPNADRTVLVGLNIDSDSDVGPPTPFTPSMIDCNGYDTEITDVSIQSGGAGLKQFISLELTAGGEPANVSFDNDGEVDEDGSQLPFRFSGSDLTVSGEGLNNLLLQLTYDTTKGNTCKIASNN